MADLLTLEALAVLASVAGAAAVAATPLLYAALGELVAEKAGVLNLGVEGMMLAGAVAGFAAAHGSGSPGLGLLAAAGAGAGLALLFGLLVLTLLANQVACGLALTIFGTGLSALAGQGLVGTPLAIPGWSPATLLPWLGPAAVAALLWWLNRTRGGLVLRAVGENHEAAHALGYPVIAIRYGALAFGGAMSGLAGAYLSLAYTPMWAEAMTAGRGWIALALVVFASWRPERVLLGAWLFGAVTFAQFHAQGLGFTVPPQMLAMLPYLATILVLVLISRQPRQIRLNSPACLGKLFHADT
jgi:simple sugar transport system permease protein